MEARTHICATYSTISGFKIGLRNHYLHFPLPFSLPCVKESRPTSANSSPVQITLRPCPIHAISWHVSTLDWLISPLPQCPGNTNLPPMQTCFPFLNLHSAEKCFCAQAGGHFCLACRAAMMVSPCNFHSVLMVRKHM
jgi:hypothetical protein